MDSTKNEYWVNAIDGILADLDIDLTLEQIEAIAKGAAYAADLYGEYTGAPGWGERFNELEREHKKTVKRLAEEIELQAEIGLRDVSALTGIPVNDLDRVETLSGPRWVSR